MTKITATPDAATNLLSFFWTGPWLFWGKACSRVMAPSQLMSPVV